MSTSTWVANADRWGAKTMTLDEFDYHGAIVVVEMSADQIVMIHPGAQSADGPASLPASPCHSSESPRGCAARIVCEMTGLEVEIDNEFTTFIQEGTPSGTMCTHGYLARPIGGVLATCGADGPVSYHHVGDLPALIPVRAAVRRVLDAYLQLRDSVKPTGGDDDHS